MMELKYIDYEQAVVPPGYQMYCVTASALKWTLKSLVSAQNPREAKRIFTNVYDYFGKDLKNIKIALDDDFEHKIYDRSKIGIHGKVTIIERWCFE